MHRRVSSLAALLVAASSACAAPDGGGVHVSVELADPGSPTWDGIFFDHVTLTATGGGKRARVCLFPSYEVEQQIAIDGGGEDPCADAHTAPWTRVPSPANWALETRARRVNFEFPELTEVHVEATARLGGGGAVARAAVDLTARDAYPSGTLRLQRADDAPVLPADAPVQLVGELPNNGQPQEVANACKLGTALAACPVIELQKAYAAQEQGAQLSSALSCVDNAIRIANTAGATTCPGGDPNAQGIVGWGTGKSGADAKLVAYLTGHFAACREGDPRDPEGCPLTTACTPPSTGIVVVSEDCATDPKGCYSTVVDLSVVPPLPVSGNVAFDIHFPLGYYAVLFVQDAAEASAPGACFFDLDRMVVVSGG